MSSFTIDVNIHAQTPIPFHRHIDFSSKNPGESFGACLGSSDWTDPSPPFHPPTLLRGQPQVEQIPNCRKFQNLNKLSFFFSSSGYGAPSTGYDSPSSGYGAPASSYDAPSDSYGTRQYRSVKVSARLYQSICPSFFCWNQPTPRTMWVIIDLWCRAWNSPTERCGQGRSCLR